MYKETNRAIITASIFRLLNLLTEENLHDIYNLLLHMAKRREAE